MIPDQIKNSFILRALGPAPVIRFEHFAVRIILFHQFTVPAHRPGYIRHSHPFCEFSLVRSGTVVYSIGENSAVCGAGKFIFIPAGANHSWKATALPAVIDGFMLDFIAGDEIGARFAQSISYSARTINFMPQPESGLIKCFSAIDTEIKNSAEYSHKRVELLIQDIICLLLRLNFPSEMLSEKVHNQNEKLFRIYVHAREYIRKNLSLGVTPLSAARAAGCTPRYLNIIFTQFSRKPCGEYIRNERLAEAHRLLCSALELSNREIAETCGFKDYYTFSRAFSRQYGLSPNKIRENFS